MDKKNENLVSGLIAEFEKKFGLWITPKQFHLLYPHINSYKSAHRKYFRVKQCLGKAEHQYLTIQEIADWEGIPAEKIYQIVFLSTSIH